MPAGARPDKTSPRFANRLYRNDRNGHFTDVTSAAGLAPAEGYAMGAATGDYDNDGHVDLYVTTYGHNLLYRNLGNGRFLDVTGRAGAGVGGWSTSSAFVDYDGDGRLDLFVCRYVQWDFDPNPYCGQRRPGYREYCHPRSFKGITNVLLRNRGDGMFEDVSAATGLDRFLGKALGVAFADLDGDSRPEIYVANDSEPAFLLHLEPSGRFVDLASSSGVAYNQDGVAVAGMGADLADWDNDGLVDLFVTALSGETYSLYRNHGGTFDYASGPTGVAQLSLPFSGWGTRLVDFDNDGFKDLLVAQGHVLDTVELTSEQFKYREPALLLRGDGRRFVPWPGASGPRPSLGGTGCRLRRSRQRRRRGRGPRHLQREGDRPPQRHRQPQPLALPSAAGHAVQPRRARGPGAHGDGSRPRPDPRGHHRRELSVGQRPPNRRGPRGFGPPPLPRGLLAERRPAAARIGGGRPRAPGSRARALNPVLVRQHPDTPIAKHHENLLEVGRHAQLRIDVAIRVQARSSSGAHQNEPSITRKLRRPLARLGAD